MACFIDTNYGYSDPRRFAMTGKLPRSFGIGEGANLEQEILDVKCLQLLRGAVHNEIVKQPDNVDSDEYKGSSSRIAQVQNAGERSPAMLKVLPNLVKPSDNIAREVLNFLAAMLYNARLDLLNKDPDAAKNLRSTEQGADCCTFLSRSKSGGGGQSRSRNGTPHHQQHQQQPISKSALFADLLPARGGTPGNSSRKTRQDPLPKLLDWNANLASAEQDRHRGLGHPDCHGDENLQMKDDGHIDDYLREQPDNMKSYNLVSKTVEYLSLVYISVTRSNISLVTQLIKTLLEFSSGNLKNQIVCYDSKCDFDEEMELKTAIAELIMALIEENIRCDKDSEAAGYAQILGENSNGLTARRSRTRLLSKEPSDGVSARCLPILRARYHSPHLPAGQDDREDLLNVGFKYFHIFKRFQDLERGKELRLEDYLNFRPSVANLKEENLQPTSCADFWPTGQGVINDISVADERVLSSRVGAILSCPRAWKAFKHGLPSCSASSSAAFVLATWKAFKRRGQPIPIRPKPLQHCEVLVLAVAHNIFSLFVLISYFFCK
uniref:RIH_assoc domain-containing protein n=1 Tax=Macrostomum lignano TaxID=282301 RepID=A0A1I8FNM7_9PLAT